LPCTLEYLHNVRRVGKPVPVGQVTAAPVVLHRATPKTNPKQNQRSRSSGAKPLDQKGGGETALCSREFLALLRNLSTAQTRAPHVVPIRALTPGREAYAVGSEVE
jgi:hypothetical protein